MHQHRSHTNHLAKIKNWHNAFQQISFISLEKLLLKLRWITFQLNNKLPSQNATACLSEHYKMQKQPKCPFVSPHQKGIELATTHSHYDHPWEVHALPHTHDYQRDIVPLIIVKPLQMNYNGCNHRESHDTDINHSKRDYTNMQLIDAQKLTHYTCYCLFL